MDNIGIVNDDGIVNDGGMGNAGGMPQIIPNQVPSEIGQMLEKQTALFNLAEYDEEYLEAKHTDEEIPKGFYTFLITKFSLTKIKSGKNEGAPGLNISLKIIDKEYKGRIINKFIVITKERIAQVKTDIKNCLGYDLNPFSSIQKPSIQKQFIGKTIQADVSYNEYEGKTFQNIYIKNSVNIPGITNCTNQNEFMIPPGELPF